MKKKLAILLTMVLVIGSLTACGSKEKNKDSVSDSISGNNMSGDVLLSEVKVEELVKLGSYKGFEVTATLTKIEEENVESSMNSVWQKASSPIGVKDREVAQGDVICLDYVGKKDGEAFAGGTAEADFLEIGSGRFIEGFESGLIGTKVGETVDLNLTFPENYPSEDLQGQEVVFTVTVNYIVPELTDENVAALQEANYTTVEELRTYVRTALEQQAQNEYETSVQSQLISSLVNGCTFEEMPAGLVQKYQANIISNMEQMAAYYGYDTDTYAAMMYGSDAATAAATYANESAKQGVALQAIANLENLNITDEDLDKQLLALAQANGAQTIEEYLDGVSKEEFREYFMFMNVVEFLKENANITEAAE